LLVGVSDNGLIERKVRMFFMSGTFAALAATQKAEGAVGVPGCLLQAVEELEQTRTAMTGLVLALAVARRHGQPLRVAASGTCVDVLVRALRYGVSEGMLVCDDAAGGEL
jgi:hypothetical protein